MIKPPRPHLIIAIYWFYLGLCSMVCVFKKKEKVKGLNMVVWVGGIENEERSQWTTRVSGLQYSNILA